jgi:hypothetical protein
MRGVIATALLVALAASPAFALWCEARCGAPEAPPSAHSGHAGHEHSAAKSSVFGLQSPILESLPAGQCPSHIQADIATPERSWTTAPALARAAFAWLEGHSPLHSQRVFAALHPPRIPQSVAPLRI